MKVKILAIISIITLLTVGCTTDVNSKQPVNEAQPIARTNIQPGTFVAGEHATQGTTKVVTENGKRYLEFNENFKTSKGPDLFVILYRNDTVPTSGIQEKDYLKIARLQKTSGNQRYAIPNNVKLVDYKSVAIWCRQFNTTFGYASLGK
ncbi:DM13 domain-containing protein [Fischerella sp. JS2]|uniref:DM13 domain-containing protein n=1 Tax=Fischerella sp. JS2 TaxID=2597771 RepID=UPI0028E61CEF|nr:DM13 domain-containing protein [Fischerella sp. JS2]